MTDTPVTVTQADFSKSDRQLLESWLQSPLMISDAGPVASPGVCDAIRRMIYRELAPEPIAAAKAAEPVAWMYEAHDGCGRKISIYRDHAKKNMPAAWTETPLYALNQQAQAAGEHWNDPDFVNAMTEAEAYEQLAGEPVEARHWVDVKLARIAKEALAPEPVEEVAREADVAKLRDREIAGWIRCEVNRIQALYSDNIGMTDMRVSVVLKLEHIAAELEAGRGHPSVVK